MSGLSSQHHVVLEEIARLERARIVIDEKIRTLRSMLPKAAPVTFTVREDGRAKEVTVEAQQVPVAVAVAAVKSASLEPRVTDHAVIRFLERRYEFAFEAARKEMLSDTVRLAVKMGAHSVKGHGGKLIIKGNQIVSFVPTHDDRSRKIRRAGKKRAA